MSSMAVVLISFKLLFFSSPGRLDWSKTLITCSLAAPRLLGS